MNTYQAVIATNGSATYVLFLYRDVQWSNAATSIGFNAGDGVRGFNLEKTSSSNDFGDIESTTNIGIPGAYIFRVDQDNIVSDSGMNVHSYTIGSNYF